MDDSESDYNPFSFTKFLERNDDNPLHNGLSKKEKKLDLPEVDALLDDVNEDNPFSIRNFTSSSSKAAQPRKLQIVDDINDKEENASENNVNKNGVISENANSDSEVSLDDRSPSPQMDSYILPEDGEEDTADTENKVLRNIEQLTSKNEDLTQELKAIRQEFLEYRQTANRRITSLQKELEKARKKEADETKALEDVVHMVEANLEASTTRAIKAETQVTRLKEELDFYKEGSVPQSEYDRLVAELNGLLNTIQEKSRNAAFLMRRAAEKTEPHLRQLQAGMESLRFLSDQFEEIGKISELPRPHNDVT